MADMDLDYTHPERRYPPELEFSGTGESTDEGSYFSAHTLTVLCRCCRWTNSNQVHSSYDSRVRITYARGNMGLWQVGSRWIIRDQPNDFTLGNDVITQKYLRNYPHLGIPVVNQMIDLSDPQDQI